MTAFSLMQVVRTGLSKKTAFEPADMGSERVSYRALGSKGILLLRKQQVQRSCGRRVLGMFTELPY